MSSVTIAATEIMAKAGFSLGEYNGQPAYVKSADDNSFIAITAADEDLWDTSGRGGLIGTRSRSVLETTAEDPAWIATRISNNDPESFIRVNEPLPLAVTLAEIEQLPTPSYDFGDEYDSWTHLLRDKYQNANTRLVRSLHDIKKFLTTIPAYKQVFDAGFSLETLGGGTLGFIKEDKGTGTLWTISAEAAVYTHPLSTMWGISRENDEAGFVQIYNCDMLTAVKNHADLPALAEDDCDEYSFNTWDDFYAKKDTIPSAKAPTPGI